MDRVEKALHSLDLTGRGLEVGPSYNPIITKASGARIETVDHATQAELVEKYRGFNLPQESLDRIEPVDYLWHGGSLLNVIAERRAYNYIIASHFFEHTVDMIGFLTDCEALLVEGGRLSLVVPDKRFCFDRFQPLSTVGNVLDAHHAGSAFHPAGALVDHQAYACTRDGALIWSAGSDGELAVQFPKLEGAKEALENGHAQQAYFDTHRWKFTPTSFELLIGDLRRLGQHRFGLLESFPTEGFEFFVTLGKDVAESAEHDRLAVLLKIEQELHDSSWSPGSSGDPTTVQITRLSAHNDELQRHNDEEQQRIDELQRHNAEEQRRIDELQRRIDELYMSRSWRMTRPFRGAGQLARRWINP